MSPIVDQLTVPLDEARARVDELLWYHTIDIAPGLTSTGWWDLRFALDLMPFPDVRGKRCLDIGPWDGFYAFEMARRGAKEVVAVDLPDLADLDYPPEVRADRSFDPAHEGKQPRSAGFRLLQELTGAPVEWRGCSIYDLDPDEIGTFDVVICGSLLIHLRDPVRALDAVRSVTRGQFLSVDYVHVALDPAARRRPLFQLRGQGDDYQWWLASDRGLRHLLHVGGFRIVDQSKRFLLTFGGLVEPPLKGWAAIRQQARNLLFVGDRRQGHPHRAYLCEPRF